MPVRKNIDDENLQNANETLPPLRVKLNPIAAVMTGSGPAWLQQALIGGLLLIAVALPFVIQSDRWLTLLTIVLIYVVLASGLNIVVGFTGLLDLGYVAFYAIGGYYTAIVFIQILKNRFGVGPGPVLVVDVGEPAHGRVAGRCRRRHTRVPYPASSWRLPGHHDSGVRGDHPHRGQQLGGSHPWPLGHLRHPETGDLRFPFQDPDQPVLHGSRRSPCCRCS